MSHELLNRGVEEVVPLKIAEEKLKSKKPIRIYFGIDPTGAQLHLGHAIPLRKLRDFADAGHEVILLIGSFTAMIGDPTGKDAMRQPLTRKDIEANFKDYQKQASKILDFKKVKVKYNHEWLEKMTFEDVIALGGEFTVQQLLHRDMYQRRLKADQPIGLHEFFIRSCRGTIRWRWMWTPKLAGAISCLICWPVVRF
ncbi:tyrosine--tRNA ligase [Candidatus Peregrinibacteria bacterium]|nr:MAG: tyrosine--tRNA ligase [Candidatus Peregrinibacteria bacterium]